MTLEISSLRNVEGDIVDYFVDDECRAAGHMIKNLALPDGVVVALIVRDEQIIPPQGRSQIQFGDHIIVVLRPGVRAMVDRVFAHRELDPVVLPTALEFPLRGSITAADVEQFYDLQLGANPDATLNEIMQSRLGPKGLIPGAAVQFDRVVLYVRELGASGAVQYVGMMILPEPEPEPEPKVEPTLKSNSDPELPTRLASGNPDDGSAETPSHVSGNGDVECQSDAEPSPPPA